MKLHLTASQSKALGAAIKPAISTEKGRYHLMTVQVATYEDHATFTATNGYVCHRVTIETPVSEWVQGAVLLSGQEFVKALAVAAKAAKYREVTISYDYGHTATVAVGDDVQTIDVIDMEFPPCDSFMRETSPLEGPAMFHGEYFADLMSAASVVANVNNKGVQRGVTIVTINPRKCGKVEAASDDGKVTFTGVIMPQRG